APSIFRPRGQKTHRPFLATWVKNAPSVFCRRGEKRTVCFYPRRERNGRCDSSAQGTERRFARSGFCSIFDLKRKTCLLTWAADRSPMTAAIARGEIPHWRAQYMATCLGSSPSSCF